MGQTIQVQAKGGAQLFVQWALRDDPLSTASWVGVQPGSLEIGKLFPYETKLLKMLLSPLLKDVSVCDLFQWKGR